MSQWRTSKVVSLVFCCVSLAVSAVRCSATETARVDKLTFHYDAARTGWNARESLLTPEAVSGGSFGRLWSTPQLDSFAGIPPRVYAAPLYVDDVRLTSPIVEGRSLSLVYVVTSTATVYAINAYATARVPAGAMVWRTVLTERPCHRGTLGNLSTPVIDLRTHRLFVSSCDDLWQWRVHALDIRDGTIVAGWPVAVNATALNAGGVNRNGATRFPEAPGYLQRGALNLSPTGSRLYVPLGGHDASGWLVVIDTVRPRVASAFSTTAVTEEKQGGIWASGGASIDAEGYVHVVTGANGAYVGNNSRRGVFAQATGNWGQSILRFRDEVRDGLQLVGTYTPFNYCQTTETDIDLGSSSAIVIDLSPDQTSTPHLLALGGGKQGNAYLLDRHKMPGGLTKRQPCNTEPSSDLSLLSPLPQREHGEPGPINIFGPYSNEHGMEDQAKSRSTASYFRDSRGTPYLYVTGSSKRGENHTVSTPPGLARLKIVTTKGVPAYLQIDQLEMSQTLQNPASPVVTSRGGEDAVVWVLDPNVPRTASLYGNELPQPVLYAFDALTLKLLWRSAAGELAPTGKYNEPTIVNGTVFVGTDRLEVFGVRAASFTEHRVTPATHSMAPVQPVARMGNSTATAAAGERIYQQRCSGCHDYGRGAAPARTMLALLDHQKILETLLYGAMQSQAAGLTEGEMNALATFLRQQR